MSIPFIRSSVGESVAKKQKISGDGTGVVGASSSAPPRLPFAPWIIQRRMEVPLASSTPPRLPLAPWEIQRQIDNQRRTEILVTAAAIDPAAVSLPPSEDEVSPADAALQTTASTELELFFSGTGPLSDVPKSSQDENDSFLEDSEVLSVASTEPFSAGAISVSSSVASTGSLSEFVGSNEMRPGSEQFRLEMEKAVAAESSFTGDIPPEFVKLKEALDALYDGKLLKNGKKPTIGNVSGYYTILENTIQESSRYVQCICLGEQGSTYAKKIRREKRLFLESYARINKDKVVAYNNKNKRGPGRFRLKMERTTETLLGSLLVSDEGPETPFAPPPPPIQQSPLIVTKDKRINPTKYLQSKPDYEYSKLQEAMDRFFRKEINARAAASLIKHETNRAIIDYSTSLQCYYKGKADSKKYNRICLEYFYKLVEHYDKYENIALRNKILESKYGNLKERSLLSKRESAKSGSAASSSNPGNGTE